MTTGNALAGLSRARQLSDITNATDLAWKANAHTFAGRRFDIEGNSVVTGATKPPFCSQFDAAEAEALGG